MDEHDVVFDAMGSQIRLLIGEPGGDMPSVAAAADRARLFVVEFEASLSRFKPESELCALNADPRPVVPASKLLRAAIKAGVAAAERSGGLVDPTLLGEIESVGYVGSSKATLSRCPRHWRQRHRVARRAPGPSPPGACSRWTTRPKP